MYNLCTHIVLVFSVRTAEEVFMKFSIGDLINYGETGVCKVEDIVERTFLGETQLCYKLMPIYQSCVIFTPVENGTVFMRPIIDRATAESSIKNVKSINPSPVSVSAPRELSAKYDAIIKTHDCAEWLNLVILIRLKKEIALCEKKKLSAIDERYGKKAEDLLYGELAAALESTKSEVALSLSEELNR